MMKERLWSTMLGDGFTILLILHLFTQGVGTLTCLSCDSVPSPTDCMYVQTCGPHSVCFLEMLVSSAGEIRYRLGCRDTAKCTPDINKRNNNITADIIPHVTEIAGADTYRSQSGFRHRRTEKLVCNRCCDSSNLCNAQGCGRNGYSLARGPVCFACDQQRQPQGCHEIQVCGRDELCYIEEFSLAGYTLYHTSCMSYSKCSYDKIIMTSSTSTHPVSFVGRGVRSRMNYFSNNSNLASLDNKRSVATSKACCDHDMCNTKLPGNGNWGPWTTWGGCTVSCGYTGTRTRTRRCNYPPPDMGGQPCPGDATEVDRTCSNRPCDTGMVCLSCDSSISPRTCNFVEVCGPHSVCYLERYVTSVGDVSFRSGCRDKKQCVNGITKRFMVSGDHLTCSECCTGDLCNSHGCGGLPYPAIRGPVCFNCDQQHDPQICNKIDVCSDGQKCGLMKHSMIDTVYQTMCLDPVKCVSDSSSNPDYPKCCSTNLCSFQANNIITPTKYTTQLITTSLPATHAPFHTSKTTKLPTTVATKATTPVSGVWSEWSAWGPCLEPSPSAQGYRERFRTCSNPLNSPNLCPHGHNESDHQYCLGGGTDACTPAKITDIKLTGVWEWHGLVMLKCEVEGYPKPEVTWLTHTDKTDETVRLFGEGTIIIGPIAQRHLGLYVCEASNHCSHTVMKNYTKTAIP